jgi:hypothetical protein
VGPGVGPLARARYVEDSLFEALAHGAHQYVIIGAGLETLAFRRPDLQDQLQVIEIDHPATQAFKRARLANAGLVAPSNLYFAAADLERERLAKALDRTPYDPAAPTFFAWPGVTAYLTRQAIFETLRSIADLAAPGSRLVFDYLEPAAFPLTLRRAFGFSSNEPVKRASRCSPAWTPGRSHLTSNKSAFTWWRIWDRRKSKPGFSPMSTVSGLSNTGISHKPAADRRSGCRGCATKSQMWVTTSRPVLTYPGRRRPVVDAAHL